MIQSVQKEFSGEFPGKCKDRLLPWFVLRSVPGIGNHLFKRLLNRFQTPEAVLNASCGELTQTEGISDRLALAVKSQKPAPAVIRELENIIQKQYRIVTMNDPDYPDLLREIPDPPPFLYVSGQLIRSNACVAVVGTRNPTSYGIFATRHLCRELAAMNISIVSGMARGIDTAAHRAALEAGGKTIAVLGSGLERIYPPENKELFHSISGSGAVISEFPLSAEPEPHHFPVRNRIISGMSLGTVVVEASRKSGSLITARLAAEQDREVFAVPGNIRSFQSAGPHGLIKQGAKLVENAQDIAEEIAHALRFHITQEHLPGEKQPAKLPPLTADEAKVFNALGSNPVHIDELVRKLSLDPGPLASLLLQLELKGLAVQTPGKLFSLDMEKTGRQ
ncbi:MAG: DNA-processing protein DprA [Desulfobacterales bacterium]